jgi:putative ABC transport system permease protein
MLTLAFAYLRDRGLVTLFNILLLALGVAALAVLLLLSGRIESRFARDSAGIDLVVGAKGSPLQLILASVYHLDAPTGNIPLATLDLLRRDPGVARAIPLALGDSFRGARIVGTEPAFLALSGAGLAEGRMFAGAGEVVVGAEAARATGLALGQQFVGSHGLGDDGHGHEATPLRVAGILAPTGTVTDRLILTSVETVWMVHGISAPPGHTHDGSKGAAREDDGHTHDHGGDPHDHGEDAQAHGAPDAPVLDRRGGPEPEVTAILVTYRNAMGAIRLPGAINRETALQAAVPAAETARFLGLFGAAIDGARLFAWLLAAVGGLSVFVVLLSAATQRAGDMALLRVMGATPAQVAGTLLLEGVLIAAAGAALGLAAAHALLGTGATLFPTLGAIGVSAWLFDPRELAIAAAVVGIGALAALLPAARLYRRDLATTLAEAT